MPRLSCHAHLPSRASPPPHVRARLHPPPPLGHHAHQDVAPSQTPANALLQQDADCCCCPPPPRTPCGPLMQVESTQGFSSPAPSSRLQHRCCRQTLPTKLWWGAHTCVRQRVCCYGLLSAAVAAAASAKCPYLPLNTVLVSSLTAQSSHLQRHCCLDKLPSCGGARTHESATGCAATGCSMLLLLLLQHLLLTPTPPTGHSTSKITHPHRLLIFSVVAAFKSCQVVVGRAHMSPPQGVLRRDAASSCYHAGSQGGMVGAVGHT
jgi:hypothetical protein